VLLPGRKNEFEVEYLREARAQLSSNAAVAAEKAAGRRKKQEKIAITHNHEFLAIDGEFEKRFHLGIDPPRVLLRGFGAKCEIDGLNQGRFSRLVAAQDHRLRLVEGDLPPLLLHVRQEAYLGYR